MPAISPKASVTNVQSFSPTWSFQSQLPMPSATGLAADPAPSSASPWYAGVSGKKIWLRLMSVRRKHGIVWVLVHKDHFSTRGQTKPKVMLLVVCWLFRYAKPNSKRKKLCSGYQAIHLKKLTKKITWFLMCNKLFHAFVHKSFSALVCIYVALERQSKILDLYASLGHLTWTSPCTYYAPERSPSQESSSPHPTFPT